MKTWKWSTGETYYKSSRTEQPEEYDSQKNAIQQSLADYGFMNESVFSRNDSRREDIDVKMSDREMISQRGVNPFLQTSYVNDIVTRDMFLKPINTTQGKNKVVLEETN